RARSASWGILHRWVFYYPFDVMALPQAQLLSSAVPPGVLPLLLRIGATPVWALLSRRSALCSPTRLPYAGRTNPVGRQTGRDLLRCADRRAALGVERVDFCHVWAPGGLFTITELIEEYLALCACPCRMIDINRQKSSLK